MPLALLVIALLLIVSGARGTYGDLKNLLVGDFTGNKNFIYWILSIIGVGSLGYIPKFQTPSRLFLGLIMISFVFANNGVFAQFMSAIGAEGSQGAAPVANEGSASNTEVGSGGASSDTASSSSSSSSSDSGSITGSSAGDGALSGAEEGAEAGAVAGPWGMLVGAVVGAAAGAASSS